MTNSCFDHGTSDSASVPALEMLADQFRRRLLSAAVLTLGRRRPARRRRAAA